MRTLSATALEKLKLRLGNEPVVIIEIQWIKDGGWQFYADRDINGIVSGKILELSDLDNVLAITDNNDSQEIQVTFDDTDGSLKAIMDSTDIHKRNVKVWQWFEGLDLDDKFLLFCGKINSPIVWNEGEQTISFSIVSQLEDKEFGFSPEEGQFPYIPVDLIGKPWPSCFGTPLDVPCVAIGKAVHGTSLAGLGILSGSGFYDPAGGTSNDVEISRGVAMQQVQAGHVSYVADAWANVDAVEWEKYNDQLTELRASINATLISNAANKTNQAQQAANQIARVVELGLGLNPVRILGGQLFPRNTITLNINGGLFTGRFGSIPNVDDDLFTITDRYHPENLAAYNNAVAEAMVIDTDSLVDGSGGGNNEFNFYSKVPCGTGDFGDTCHYRTQGYIIYNSTFNSCKSEVVVPIHFWADAGSQVTLYGNEPITYIVSIVPGTVLSVKAFKTFNGVKHLVNVPDNYYYTETKAYGSITAVQVVLYKTLSTIPDQNWDDDIFVTFKSDIGPNIVDILEYIIDTYTDFSFDSSSFDDVRDKIELFTANFAVLDRKNILTILQEIAFQARCNLRLINDTFYLTYLPEEPVSIDTITESDIEVNSINVSGSATEDLITKLVVEWRTTYAQDALNKLILRHNIEYYGTQEETMEFYIYNEPDIILKVATFWLIRKSNTWKHINFRTFLHKLNLETLDCVLLDFEKNYVSTGVTKALIKKANFNSQDQAVDIECWLPIKFGTLIQYDFAWPANIPPEWIYPTDYEVDWGHAGGSGVGEDAEGELPIDEVNDTTSADSQFTSSDSGVSVFISKLQIGDETFGKRGHDTGDKHPSDASASFIAEREAAFKRASAYQTTKAGEIQTSPNPVKAIVPLQNQPSIKPREIPLPSDGIILDLSKTKVRDNTDNEEALSYLSDLIHFNAEGDKLCLRSDLLIWDVGQEDPSVIFDFKYDAESDMWGAGTAWLKPA